MDLKVDLQNHLYNSEVAEHLDSNIEQILTNIGEKYPQDVHDSAKYLHNETVKVLSFLDNLGEQMIEINGGRNEDYIPINRNQSINLENQFKSNQKDVELIKILKKHEELLKSFGIKYSRIVFESKDLPILKNDPLLKDKNFIELHFGDRNIFEALSSIEYLKTSVLLKESTALTLLTIKE